MPKIRQPVTPAGHLIRRAREHADMTQAEVANFVGVRQSVISRWETGAVDPTFDNVLRAVGAANFNLDITLRGKRRAEGWQAATIMVGTVRPPFGTPNKSLGRYLRRTLNARRRGVKKPAPDDGSS
ncbi:MAG TPA: helix-turn-helix transcriptional regulator [Solirubrobacterales bacterium]|jgi:transcriptional regulator with XRE-family HTH domain|nr:helix-turn-helix transcriptional regulator [Solirubrobacterales bacterium]